MPLACFQGVDTLRIASKHAEGMSLRYDESLNLTHALEGMMMKLYLLHTIFFRFIGKTIWVGNVIIGKFFLYLHHS